MLGVIGSLMIIGLILQIFFSVFAFRQVTGSGDAALEAQQRVIDAERRQTYGDLTDKEIAELEHNSVLQREESRALEERRKEQAKKQEEYARERALRERKNYADQVSNELRMQEAMDKQKANWERQQQKPRPAASRPRKTPASSSAWPANGSSGGANCSAEAWPGPFSPPRRPRPRKTVAARGPVEGIIRHDLDSPCRRRPRRRRHLRPAARPVVAAPFEQLGLAAPVLANLARLGYHQMTPIQAASLPVALAGNDLIAQAKTGSGKTAAFGLPLLQRLDPRNFAVQAMVLCPTRELAEQVSQEIRRLARFEENIKVLTLCGGARSAPRPTASPTAPTWWWARRAG
jgi:superfamily II DNA/RNA helicase